MIGTLLAKEGAGAPSTVVAPETRTEVPEDDARWLCCAQCHHRITTEKAKCTREGRHEHMRGNPGGFLFVFGCFARAPGAKLASDPSDEATWFAGYQWAITVCGNCSTHLGWHFTGDAPFFGLILERLVDLSAPSA